MRLFFVASGVDEGLLGKISRDAWRKTTTRILAGTMDTAESFNSPGQRSRPFVPSASR